MSCCVAMIAERRSASSCSASFARLGPAALLLLRSPSCTRLRPLLLGTVTLEVSNLANLLLCRFIDGFFKIPAAKQGVIEHSRFHHKRGVWRANFFQICPM